MAFSNKQKQAFRELVKEANIKLSKDAIVEARRHSAAIASSLAEVYFPKRGYDYVKDNLVSDAQTGEVFRVLARGFDSDTPNVILRTNGAGKLQWRDMFEVEKKHRGIDSPITMLKKILGERHVQSILGLDSGGAQQKDVPVETLRQLTDEASAVIANQNQNDWPGYLEGLGFHVQRDKGMRSIIQFRGEGGKEGARYGLVIRPRSGTPFVCDMDDKRNSTSLLHLELSQRRFTKWSDAIKHYLGEQAYASALGLSSTTPAAKPRKVATYKPTADNAPEPVNFRKLNRILRHCHWGTWGKAMTEVRKISPDILSDPRFAKSMAAFEFPIPKENRICKGTLFPMHFDGKITSFERYFDPDAQLAPDNPNMSRIQFKTGMKGFWRSQNSFANKCSRLPVLVVGESPIDMLSHAQLFGNSNFAYIAPCGNPSEIMITEEFPRLLKEFKERFNAYPHLVFGFDNDKAGFRYDEQFLEVLPGEYQILGNGERIDDGRSGVKIIKPPGNHSDWNDYLKATLAPGVDLRQAQKKLSQAVADSTRYLPEDDSPSPI